MIDRTVFLEEASDLLVELESALLELERTPSDMELIQRVFRALHTIKGSGAMFGFDEVSHFTHQLESTFERVRTGAVAATPELIHITLQARDHIKALLAETSYPGAAERELGILSCLEAILRQTDPCAAPAVESASRTHRVRFRPAPDIFLKGTNPLLLFRELSELGSLTIRVDDEYLPPFDELDPERSYLGWTLELTTVCPQDAIQDVFIFVEDSLELEIRPVERAADAPPAPSPVAVPAPAAAVSPTAEKVAPSNSMRVAADKLDALVNFVGELVIVQARLSDLASRSEDPETHAIAEEVERLTSGLRDNAMSIRMLPLRATFERFRRLVHDLTRNLGKEIRFETEGADTELDKTVIEQLSDPLVHLIRNSVDHGIEYPEERETAGKARFGTIRLSAVHSGANVLIRVNDDGRGLDPEAVRSRAVEKGLIAPDAKLSESDILSLILMPGFSTAQTITDLSGRGVGMDVVRRSVQALRGSVEVASNYGTGTTVTLRLPLTLAIIDGLLSRVGTAHFVVPLSHVIECVELSRADVQAQHGNHTANVRGDLVPYIPLREYLDISGARPNIEQIIIMETPEGRCGFAVDEVLGDHQTVIKNLGRLYRDVQVISGATILGDGTVALILDPHRLVQDVIAGEARRPASKKTPGRRVNRVDQNSGIKES